MRALYFFAGGVQSGVERRVIAEVIKSTRSHLLCEGFFKLIHTEPFSRGPGLQHHNTQT